MQNTPIPTHTHANMYIHMCTHTHTSFTSPVGRPSHSEPWTEGRRLRVTIRARRRSMVVGSTPVPKCIYSMTHADQVAGSRETDLLGPGCWLRQTAPSHRLIQNKPEHVGSRVKKTHAVGLFATCCHCGHPQQCSVTRSFFWH